MTSPTATVAPDSVSSPRPPRPEARRGGRFLRLPVLFEAGPEPIPTPHVRIDTDTTPRQLVLRTIAASFRWTIPGALMSMLHFVAISLIPVIIARSIDSAIAQQDLGSLIVGLVVLTVNFLVFTTSYRFGGRLGFLGMNAVQHQLRMRVTDRILDPRGIAGERRAPGALLSVATSDTGALASSCAIMIYPTADAAAILAGGVILLVVAWPLGVAMLVAAPLLLLLVDYLIRPLMRRIAEQQQQVAVAAGVGADVVEGVRVIKGLGARDEAAQRYRRSSRSALQAMLRTVTAEARFQTISDAVGVFLVIGLIVAAGFMATSGRISVGDFVVVVATCRFLLGPMQFISGNFGRPWSAAHASGERVLGLLLADYRRTAGVAETAAGAAAGVAAEDTRAGTANVLDLRLGPDRLQLRRGETVVLTAPPAEVERLAGLLNRDIPDAEARFHFYGRPASVYDIDEYRRRMVVAPHAADLFDGTVLDNIAAVADAAAPEAVDAAIIASATDTVIDVLPQGAHTSVGEAGRFLSGGQRQRVALARALAAEPEVLVLFDPTTAVDSVTENTIAERVLHMRRGQTTLVVTASPAFRGEADRVIDLTVDRDAGTVAPAAEALAAAGRPDSGQRDLDQPAVGQPAADQPDPQEAQA